MIGAMLPKAVAFLLLPIYTIYLSPEDYGIISTINATASVIIIFFLLGIQSSSTRLYYDYSEEKDRNAMLGLMFIIIVITSLTFTIILFVFRKSISTVLLPNMEDNTLYIYLLIIAFLSIFPILPNTALRVKEKPYSFVFYNLIQSLIFIALNIYFVVIVEEGANGTLKAIIISSLIMAIIFSTFMIKYVKSLTKEFLNLSKIKGILIFSFPFIIHLLSWSVLSVSDRIMLAKFSTLDQVGIYSLGSQFMMIITIVVTSLNQAITPNLLRKYHDNNALEQRFMNKIIISSLVLIGLIGIVFNLILEPLIYFMSDDMYHVDYEFVDFLIISALFHTAYLYVVVPLFINKKSLSISVITGLSALANILLNYISIEEYGILGVAIATCISKSLMFLGVFFTSKKEYVGYKYPLLLTFLIISIFSIIIFLN